jgi:DNA-binding transcriptional regulator YiaG
LTAAEFYASTMHEKAIVSFNRAIIHLLKNNKPAAYEELRNAVKLSKKEIISYANYSKLLKRLLPQTRKSVES